MKQKIINALLGACVCAFALSAGTAAAYAKAEEIRSPVLTMKEGASIRYFAPTGIRFVTEISLADYETIVSADENAVFGTLVIPAELLGDTQITADNYGDLDAELIEAKEWLPDTESVRSYAGALVGTATADGFENFPVEFYDCELIAVSYCAYDGKVIFAENPQTYSMAYTASALLAEGAEDEFLSEIVGSVLAEGLSFDAESYTLTVGETTETALVSGGKKVNLKAEYTSDSETITVDENGVISASEPGSATITATIGNLTARAAVTSETPAPVEVEGTKYYDASEDSMTLSLSEAGIPAAVTEVKVEGITVTHTAEGDTLAVSGVYEALGLAENWNFGAKKMSVFSGGTEYTLDVIVVSKIIMQSDVTDDPISLHSILYNDAYKSEGETVTNWGGYYVLGENITFNANKMNEMPSWITGTGDRFNGTFDGRGYTISNYTAGANGAMFTYLGVNAVIRNIHFVNAKIGYYSTASTGSGGIVAVLSYQGSVIENVYLEVTIAGVGTPVVTRTNGMFVRNNNGTIRNCIAVVQDGGWTSERHGYIASINGATGAIENCYAIVTLTFEENTALGGIVSSCLASQQAGDYSTSKVYESADAFFADEEVTGALQEKGYNDYWTFDAENKTISMNPAEE